MWMKTKTSIIKQQLLALKKKQLCTLTFFKLLKFRFNTFFLHIPGWFEPIFLVKYIFLFCEGLEEDLTCLETRTIFLCDLHLAYILQDQVLQGNSSKSLLFSPPFLFHGKAFRKRSMSDAHEINDNEKQCFSAGLSSKQFINPPMDNVGIICCGAGGGSKYIHNIHNI